MDNLKVYLAGGMRSTWRDTLMQNNRANGYHFNYINPIDHQLDTAKQYTTWDLFAVKHCDILFGYMEDINTSGYGLALEIGYAKALGKVIILVNEKSLNDSKFSYNFAIVNSCADVSFPGLDDGVEFLRSFDRIKNSNTI